MTRRALVQLATLATLLSWATAELMRQWGMR